MLNIDLDLISDPDCSYVIQPLYNPVTVQTIILSHNNNASCILVVNAAK